MQETWDHWCLVMEIHQPRGGNPGGFDSLVMSRHENMGRVSPKTSPQKPTNPCETWDLPTTSHHKSSKKCIRVIQTDNNLHCPHPILKCFQSWLGHIYNDTSRNHRFTKVLSINSLPILSGPDAAPGAKPNPKNLISSWCGCKDRFQHNANKCQVAS